MSKKHYVATAKILASQLDRFGGDRQTRHAVIETTHALADYMQSENPQFDRARFLAACGING